MEKDRNRLCFKRWRWPVDRGFTLTEAVVVVAILAILASIGVGSLAANREKYRANEAIREFLTTVRLARRYAIQYGQTYQIDVDRAQRQYSLTDGTTAVKTITLPEGITFGPNNAPAPLPNPYSGIATNRVACSFCDAATAAGSLYFCRDGTSGTDSTCATFSDGTVSVIPLDDMTNNRQDRIRAVGVRGPVGLGTIYAFNGTTWQR